MEYAFMCISIINICIFICHKVLLNLICLLLTMKDIFFEILSIFTALLSAYMNVIKAYNCNYYSLFQNYKSRARVIKHKSINRFFLFIILKIRVHFQYLYLELYLIQNFIYIIKCKVRFLKTIYEFNNHQLYLCLVQIQYGLVFFEITVLFFH